MSAAITSSDAEASGFGNGVAVTVDSPYLEWAADVAKGYAEDFVDHRIGVERERIALAQAVL